MGARHYLTRVKPVLGAVKLLLENGAHVNKVCNNGRTALFDACMRGDIKIIEFLIAHGADVNIVDKDGETVLCWTIRYFKNDYRVADFLIATGKCDPHDPGFGYQQAHRQQRRQQLVQQETDRKVEQISRDLAQLPESVRARVIQRYANKL